MKILQLIMTVIFVLLLSVSASASLEDDFVNPPDSSRPGVYWYFMDGNLSREAMTSDLESMKEVGLGNLVFLEVNVGVPRGPVDFMSDQWQDLFAHAVRESERLGIDITLGSGPGWTGSGGPWVKPEQAMQHLLTSSVEVEGPSTYDAVLPAPDQHPTPWGEMKTDFYEDIAVYAFPKCGVGISDINEKALYDRYPYTSAEGVKQFLPAPVKFDELGAGNVISPKDIIDISKYLGSDGRLKWDVPEGEWTIVRMVRRATCASTRPAPEPGVGLECDKFDTAALDHHFANYYGKLLEKVGPRKGINGWTAVHIDSWEMGAQNWTKNFLAEFKNRRGYGAKPYLLTYSGRAVSSLEESERFLWDVRLTCQELVLENHAGHLKKFGRKHGFELSIEPYDMNPTADLDLGAVADVPMCEFWSVGFGFDSSFSCIESSSIAHTMGRSIVSAEAFTAGGGEKWQQYPWSMKNQGDWAFCMGVNRFVYHTFAHKPLGDEYRPGMTMGPIGVHWDRGQTWWPMVKDYHKYITRCSYLLRHGVTVSDILYLTPEGAPHVFRAPDSALEGKGPLADKKGYGFDGCSPNILMDRAEVNNGRIEFPGGTSYRIMVLPEFATMTPKLLTKIESFVKAGATIIGSPPTKSPSLENYPDCDSKVKELAKKLWGTLERPAEITKREYGRGVIYFGGPKPEGLYPEYDNTVSVLKEMGVTEDFTSDGPVRYGHRTNKDRDIYFVSNKSDELIHADCTFRVAGPRPQLWNAVTGETRALPQCKIEDGLTTIPMQFHPYESFFVIFSRKEPGEPPASAGGVNFPAVKPVATIEGAWQVSFDPKWGGPKNVTFETLTDWTQSEQRGIKYYSGIATYRKSFNFSAAVPTDVKIYLDLGIVNDIARVKLNGQDLGVVWCAPWQVEITDILKKKDNKLEIEVANRWPNRLLGDQQAPDKDVRTVRWESGLLGGKEYKTGRYTFATTEGLDKLLPCGLLGPVKILAESSPFAKTEIGGSINQTEQNAAIEGTGKKEDLELMKHLDSMKEPDKKLTKKWDLPEDVLGDTSTDKLFLHFVQSPLKQT